MEKQLSLQMIIILKTNNKIYKAIKEMEEKIANFKKAIE